MVKRMIATSKKVINEIILNTVKLIAALLILYWSLQPEGLITQFLGKDLSFLLPSIIVLSIILYISSLIETIFIMRIAEIFCNALNGLAVALALHLFNLTPLAPDLLYSMDYWLFACILIAIFNYVAKSLAELYHEPLVSIFSTSLSLFLFGFSFSNILAVLIVPLSLPPETSIFLFWSFTAAAIIFWLTAFRNFSNPYLRYLGEKIDSHIASIIFLLILIQIYFTILRPYIISHSHLFVPASLIEWGVICLSFWLFYRNLKKQVKEHLTEPLNLGCWTMLKQEISHQIDPEQRSTANLVEEFIEYGTKDGIITQLAAIMLLNGVKEEYVRHIVKKILDFHEVPYPKICLKPWLKGIDEENKRRRKELMEEIVHNIRYYCRAALISKGKEPDHY